MVLALAVLGISSSAVLVRLMSAPPVAVAAWRCLFAAVLLSPALRYAKGMTGRDLRWIGLAGVFLGMHFAAWFASLDYTTVLRSTVLVALVPVWTGLLEWALTGRRPPTPFWVGIGLALLGVASMSTGEQGTAGWKGDALAAFAGVLWSVYLLVGRDVRQRVHIGTYMCLVSGFASLSMWPLAFATGTPVWGFPLATWGWLVVATLGPQLMGHQGFSYAVKYLPASTIAAIMLLEPVGSSALAAAVLQEWPPATALLGGAIVIAGVLVALRAAPVADEPDAEAA
ncbi:MAG: DMT family transporter [Alphaproteobacteria bacterium]|nr:DMT family transporter [Alphaproteobacteria bacterium]